VRRKKQQQRKKKRLLLKNDKVPGFRPDLITRSATCDLRYTMKLIIGLGNPGFRYRNTRHNAGFLVIKALAHKHRVRLKKKGFGGVYGIGTINQREVTLFEPMTYMNLSGEAVKNVCASKLRDTEEMLVVSDDVSLSLGQIRLREKGSGGGHNGLQSIIEEMGRDFPRLRIGIGPEDPSMLKGDLSSYVLTPFLKKERAVLEAAVDKAVKCIEMWLSHGPKKAMSLCNE